MVLWKIWHIDLRKIKKVQTFNISLDDVKEILYAFRYHHPVLKEISESFTIKEIKTEFIDIKHEKEDTLWAINTRKEIYEFTKKTPKYLPDITLGPNDSILEEDLRELDKLMATLSEDYKGYDYYLYKDKEILAQFLIQDEERKEITDTLLFLKNQQKKTILLNQNSQHVLWGKLFSDIHYILEPKKLQEIIKNERRFGKIALFTKNISSSLAQLRLNFSPMSQIKPENADILFLNPELSTLQTLLTIARNNRQKTKMSYLSLFLLFLINTLCTIKMDFSILPSFMFLLIIYGGFFLYHKLWA